MWDIIYNTLIILGIVTLALVSLVVWPSRKRARRAAREESPQGSQGSDADRLVAGHDGDAASGDDGNAS